MSMTICLWYPKNNRQQRFDLRERVLYECFKLSLLALLLLSIMICHRITMHELLITRVLTVLLLLTVIRCVCLFYFKSIYTLHHEPIFSEVSMQKQLQVF